MPPESDLVDDLLAEADAALEQQQVSGVSMYDDNEGLEEVEEVVSGLVDIGGLTEVGAAAVLKKVKGLLSAKSRKMPQQNGTDLPSPAFARSGRETARRAPLGFVEDGTNALGSFSIAAGPGTTTVVRGKVSRVAHVNRLLIVPSAPGIVIGSIKVGDEEQMLAQGVPAELYGASALTDTIADDFSPLQTGIDMIITLINTTAAPVTGTIGSKATCKR